MRENKKQTLQQVWLWFSRLLFVYVLFLTLYIVGTILFRDIEEVFEEGLVGISFGERPCSSEDCLHIVDHVFPNSPAERAGMEAGDKILQVDGWHYPLKIGPAGTVVDLKIEKIDGEIVNYLIEREPGLNVDFLWVYRWLGFSFLESVWIFMSLQLLVFAASFGAAVFMAVRRWDNWFLLFIGTVLLLLSIWFPRFYIWTRNQDLLGQIFLLENWAEFLWVLFVLLLPDGKIRSGWDWVVIFYSGYVTIFNQFVPVFEENLVNNFISISPLLLVTIMLLLRFRGRYTLADKQQFKWIVYGITLVMLPKFGFPIIDNLFEQSFVGGTSPAFGLVIYAAMAEIFERLTEAALPIIFVISMLKYRLYDVNYVINRSVVYGGLTVVLGIVFGVGFVGVDFVLSSLMGLEESSISAGVSALLVMGVFSPVRKRVRRLVDQQLYGIELDYEEALKEYYRFEKKLDRREGQASSFGQYSQLELVGKGGMGEVYLGKHKETGELAAIKILPQELVENEINKKRFLREVDAIAKLDHPNIVKLYEYGESNGVPYIVMEYIDGQDLAGLLDDRGRLDFEEAYPLVKQVGAALDYVHGMGIVHRDIKPSNVVVEINEAGELVRAVLMDFGLAKVMERSQLTQTGGMLGTLAYVSPEQVSGVADVDHRADIYSFGVMAFEMLTGELPFKHNNPAAMVLAHMMEPAPSACDVLERVPKQACTVIQQAMAKIPEERFENLGAMTLALKG